MAEVRAQVTGSVWKLLVGVGQEVAAGQEVAILESMKMEIPVEAEAAGVVREICVEEGDAVAVDALILRLEEAPG